MSASGNTTANQGVPAKCKTPLGANRQATYTKRLRSSTAISDAAAALERQIALLSRDPTKPLPAAGGTVHIGFDGEWQYVPETGRNGIICYTACVVSGDKSCTFIHFTKGPDPRHRLALQKFLGMVLAHAMKVGVINDWPSRVIMCAHFLRADIAHFTDFFPEFSRSVDGLRRSVTSLKRDVEMNVESEEPNDRRYRGEVIYVKDAARKTYAVHVRFVDTMMLTPANMGLKEAGAMIGLDKLELPAGYDISQMAKFFAERPKEAEAYAIRDAEIAVRYYLEVRQLATGELGLRSLPPTISAMSVQVFKKGLKEDGRDGDHIFGYGQESVVYWNTRTQSPARIKRTQTTADRRVYDQFATDCYRGGRNECFHVGPAPLGLWYDFDLISAYPMALVDLLEVDYAAARIERDPNAYCGHVFGLARVRFSFPTDTRFPSLPVTTAERGLYFPLTGVTYCTAPEIEVALGLGAKITILFGVIMPWVMGSKPIFESFVRIVRAQRQRHTKGGLAERLWKEIGNSLYGKLAQGLREKSAFDTRTGRGREVPPSPITNPYFAAHATGLVRAVLSELIARVPPHRSVLSVTTDGFLTDAPTEELDLSGPMCRRFMALHARVEGGGHDA